MNHSELLSDLLARWRVARGEIRELSNHAEWCRGGLSSLQAKDESRLFTIIGAGASLNGLNEDQFSLIEAGTTAAINMSAMAPMRLDLVALEHLKDPILGEELTKKLNGQSHPPSIWLRDDQEFETPQLVDICSIFPTTRHKVVDLSGLPSPTVFAYLWMHAIRRRVIDAPDIRLVPGIFGTASRLLFLALMLGYQRIGFAGVDLNDNPYFWQEEQTIRCQRPWKSASSAYRELPISGRLQGSANDGLTLIDLISVLAKDRDAPEFVVFDPANRSALSQVIQSA